jgi:hypothetical protein
VKGLEVAVLALTTRLPRKTWLHPSSRSICSADGPACFVFGQKVCSWLRSYGPVPASASQELPSLLFIWHSPVTCCGLLRSYITEAAPEWPGNHQKGEYVTTKMCQC